MKFDTRIEKIQQKTLEGQRGIIQNLIDGLISLESNNTIIRDIILLWQSVSNPSSQFCLTILHLIYWLLEQAEQEKETFQKSYQQLLKQKLQEIHDRESDEFEDIDILLNQYDS